MWENATSVCQPLDIAHMASPKASFRVWCWGNTESSARDAQHCGQHDLASRLKDTTPYLHWCRIQEAHAEAQVDSAWKNFLGNHAEIYGEAEALNQHCRSPGW